MTDDATPTSVTVVRCSALIEGDDGNDRACGYGPIKGLWLYCPACGHPLTPSQRRASERAMKASKR